MADANTTVDLDGLQDAIATALAAQFPAFKTVEFYREDEDERIPTPALLLELVEAEPAPDMAAGTGQWPAQLRFAARVVIHNRGAESRREVRSVATSLAAALHNRRWPGMRTDEAEVIACEPDEFAPNLDRFCVWLVEWRQLAFFGVNAWDHDGGGDGIPYYSFSPIIGVPHEPEYKPAGEGIEVTP